MTKDQDKRSRVTISIPEKLLSKVDYAASQEYTNRSQWIIYAMLEKLRKSDNLNEGIPNTRKRKDGEYDLFHPMK